MTGAVIISLLAAYWLDLRLKARLPANRTFMWGFFFGCICIAFAPLAVLSGVEAMAAASRAKWAACQVHAIYTVIFALNVVSGGFILRRKSWAWILGTCLSPICAFPVLRDLLGPDLALLGFSGCIIWLANYLYGRKRWAEFHKPSCAPALADHKLSEPWRLLTSVEAKAQRHDMPTPCLEDTLQSPEHSLTPGTSAPVSAQAQRDSTEGSLAPVFRSEAGVGATRKGTEPQRSEVFPAR